MFWQAIECRKKSIKTAPCELHSCTRLRPQCCRLPSSMMLLSSPPRSPVRIQRLLWFESWCGSSESSFGLQCISTPILRQSDSHFAVKFRTNPGYSWANFFRDLLREIQRFAKWHFIETTFVEYFALMYEHSLFPSFLPFVTQGFNNMSLL